MVGADRIQLVWGPSTVKGELLFEDFTEVNLVKISTDSWTENTVGFQLTDPSNAPVIWPDITCPLTGRLERWLNRRGYHCDLTVGLGWQNPTEMHNRILRRWKAFRSKTKNRSE